MEESSVENAPKGWRKSLDYWRTRSSKLEYENKKLREDWARAEGRADYEKKGREEVGVECDKLEEENKSLCEKLMYLQEQLSQTYL